MVLNFPNLLGAKTGDRPTGIFAHAVVLSSATKIVPWKVRKKGGRGGLLTDQNGLTIPKGRVIGIQSGKWRIFLILLDSRELLGWRYIYFGLISTVYRLDIGLVSN